MGGAGDASRRGYDAVPIVAERRTAGAVGISACRERAASLATGSRRLLEAFSCAP